MNYKEVFVDYVEDRELVLVGKVEERYTGVYGVIQSRDQETLKKQFTQLTRFIGADLIEVRLSYKDFFNETITEGFIQEECSHFDNRVCQALGH